jgi:hypothetical protein
MKLHIVLLCGLFLSISSFCVEDRFSIGIKGGISLYQARITYSPDSEPTSQYLEYKSNVNSNLYFEYLQNNNISHSLNLIFYQAGGKLKLDEYNNGQFVGHFWSTIVLNYLSIGYSPIFKIPVKKFIPYLSPGLSIDYLIGKDEYWIIHNNKEYFNGIDIDDFNRMNYRLIISSGIEYGINKIGILCEYAFSYNLLPFISKSKNAENIGIEYTTNGHLINIGMKFKI